MVIWRNLLNSIDQVFLVLSRYGPRDDIQYRKWNAIFFLSAWIGISCLCILATIDYWLYPVKAAYLELWPYRSQNTHSVKSAGFLFFLVALLPALWLSWKASLRCEDRISINGASGKDHVMFYVCALLVLFISTLAKFRYGAPLTAAANIILFFVIGRKCRS